MGSPFLTYAGMLERSTHLIHTYLPNDPAVVAYQFWGGNTVNDAYGNPAASGVGGSGAVAMFTVLDNKTFRSPTLRRKGLGLVPENRRGMTHALFDLDDYIAPGTIIPPDEQWLYLRVQENHRVAGLLTVPGPLPVLGPIYCVPPMATMGLPQPSFTMQGIAPSATTSAAGGPPIFSEDLTSAIPRPMVLVLPFPMSEFNLTNLDGVKTLLVSFGPGQLMQPIAPGNEVQLYSGSTKMLVLATSAAGGCPFALHGVLGRS
jgi:hypothetical protein